MKLWGLSVFKVSRSKCFSHQGLFVNALCCFIQFYQSTVFGELLRQHWSCKGATFKHSGLGSCGSNWRRGGARGAARSSLMVNGQLSTEWCISCSISHTFDWPEWFCCGNNGRSWFECPASFTSRWETRYGWIQMAIGQRSQSGHSTATMEGGVLLRPPSVEIAAPALAQATWLDSAMESSLGFTLTVSQAEASKASDSEPAYT